MWRSIRVVPIRSMVKVAATAIVLTALLLAGCDMPSLLDLDEPAGDSTLALLPSAVNLEVSTQTTFTAKGGESPYTFEASDGTIVPSGSTANYTAPPIAGTYIVSVTDADGIVSEATVMVTATVPLNVSPASITVAAGTTVELVASGGSGGYWFELGMGAFGTLTSTGSTTATYRTVNAESAQITLHSGSDSVDAHLTFTDPPTLSIVPALVALYVNTVFTFTATGGTGGYTYSCTGNGTVDPATGMFTAGSTGGSPAYVTVEDDGGRTKTATVGVNSLPGVPKLSPSDVHVGVGGTVTFTVSEGTPDYTYTLTGLGSISPTGPTSQATTTYTAPLVSGNGITMRVTDGLGKMDTATIYVDPPPTLQINPATVTLTTNEGVTFTATGGSGEYRYTVVTGTGAIPDPFTGVFTAPAVAESDTVRVTDSGGRTCDATVDVYFPLTIVPTDVFVRTNGTYTFSASGGKETYHYYVTSGSGTIGELSGVYTAPGTFGSATVQVLDALGNASYAAVTVFSSTWTIQSVDTALKSGQYASLALDSNDYPRVAYYESKNKELRLASWDGASWSSQMVDSAGTVGQYCSLAIDPTGNARISYYDSSNRDLKYAAWNGLSWDLKVVDSAGTVGQYTSLALDRTTGYPRISYYDSQNRRLKFASWNGSAWTVSIVDKTPFQDVGMYSSLALDPTTSKPRIAYYDATSAKLKYAAWDGSAWKIENPDAFTLRGQHCSLAIDTAGNPHISYYNSGTSRLWYAWSDGTWHTQEVESSATDRGTYSSLALAPSTGYPRISYYDATDKKLVFASYTGSGWNIRSTIDGASNVGQYSSLRLRSDDERAVIAYYSQSAQDLKVAKE
jgi:hypothetical protein